MAKWFRPAGPAGGVPADVSPHERGVAVHAGVDTTVLPWATLTAKPAGWEDAWTEISAEVAGQREEVWVDASEIGALAAAAPPGSALHGAVRVRDRRAASRVGWQAIFGLLVIAGVVWLVTGGPARYVLGAIPASVEVKIGDAAAGSLELGPPCDDPELKAVVDGIVADLAEALPDRRYTFRVDLAQTDDVNAFALPGGRMFVLSGLLSRLDSPSELAAVLGHEIHHVLLRHALRKMVQAAGVQVVLALLFGDASDTVAMVAGGAAQLTQLKFSRDQERDADLGGVRLMAKAGYDPRAAASVFAKLAEASGEEAGGLGKALSIAGTHPASAERIETMRTEAASLAIPASPRRAELDWASLRGRCAAAR
jgi:Zn-dependent protease with chaperone function